MNWEVLTAMAVVFAIVFIVFVVPYYTTYRNKTKTIVGERGQELFVPEIDDTWKKWTQHDKG